MSNVKLEDTPNRRRLHIGAFFVDLNETDYRELIDIFGKEAPKLCADSNVQKVFEDSLPTAVASIRSNFVSWSKGDIKDGVFAWHLQNNLLRIEKELGWENKDIFT